MQKRIFLITLGTILLISLSLKAQDETNVVVKKSADKVKIEGKYYFIHIVQKGETLYSISKAYNVSQMEIAMENPDIYLGIQVEQSLKIPIKDSSNAPDTQSDDDYIYHIVRKGETLFGLSKKYSIPIETLISINPEVESGIKISQVILIPKGDWPKLSAKNLSEGERFIYHEVRPKEGFYTITRKYGVSEQTIRRFNADLVADGLKLGTILRIPNNPADTIPEPIALPDSIHGATDTILVAQPDCDDLTVQRNKKERYNVALLLPFYTRDFQNPNSMMAQEAQGVSTEPKEISKQSMNFLDFYQGALLALDQMKEEGMNVDLHVFDTNNSAAQAKELTKEEAIGNADLLIGPVYPDPLRSFLPFVNQKGIPIVSPLLSTENLLSQSPHLIQVPPSFQTQLRSFVNNLNFCNGQNIVIIHDADSTNDAMLSYFKLLIKNRIESCENEHDIHYKEVTYSPGSLAPQIVEKISQSLSEENENMVIVPSNNEAFVADLLGNLSTLTSYYQYSINLYGFPRWQRFRSIQLEYFYDLELHIFSPTFVDYTNNPTIQFISEYRSRFRSEPTSFSFQGYDVMLYFLGALNEYGTGFIDCLYNYTPTLLQSEYNFVRSEPDGGLEDSSVYLLRYNKDFFIERVPSITATSE